MKLLVGAKCNGWSGLISEAQRVWREVHAETRSSPGSGRRIGAGLKRRRGAQAAAGYSEQAFLQIACAIFRLLFPWHPLNSSDGARATVADPVGSIGALTSAIIDLPQPH